MVVMVVGDRTEFSSHVFGLLCEFFHSLFSFLSCIPNMRAIPTKLTLKCGEERQLEGGGYIHSTNRIHDVSECFSHGMLLGVDDG